MTVVSRALHKLQDPVEPLPDQSELSNEELVVGICLLQSLDRPQWLRAAAQLISQREVDLSLLCFLARKERVERILAELARQALKVDPAHPIWCGLVEAFGSTRPLRDSLLHWTRLAEPTMRPGRPNAAGWKLA